MGIDEPVVRDDKRPATSSAEQLLADQLPYLAFLLGIELSSLPLA